MRDNSRETVDFGRRIDLAMTPIDWQKRQVRAYAFPTPIGVIDFGNDKVPIGGIIVRTMGQTPAYKVRGEVNTGGMAYPLTFTLKAPAGDVLNQATLDAINDGKKFRLYVWGRVDYEDVFKEPHWFTFCYIYNGADIRPPGASETCPRHNDDDHH